MNPFVAGALISGGANILGGLFSQSSARSAYEHRYQDTVADLKKAGLNPALAYGQNPGGGAQTHDFGNIGSDAIQGAQAAQNAKQSAASTRLTNAQAGLLEQQTKDLLRSTKARADVDELRPYGELQKNISREARAFVDMLTSRQREATNASDVRARLDANDITRIEHELTRLSLPQQRAVAKYFEGPIGRNEGNIDKILDVIRAIGGFRKGDRSFTTNNYMRGNR